MCFVRIHLLENGNRKTSIAALVKVSSKLPFFTVSEITLTNTGITLAFTGITITFTGITLTFTGITLTFTGITLTFTLT